MSNERDELIIIQSLVNSIILKVESVNAGNDGFDIFHENLTDLSNRLQTLIENLEVIIEEQNLKEDMEA